MISYVIRMFIRGVFDSVYDVLVSSLLWPLGGAKAQLSLLQPEDQKKKKPLKREATTKIAPDSETNSNKDQRKYP